jgi:hypothetical protein
MKRTAFFFGIFLLSAVSLHAQDVSLTVYNQDRALVREIRTIPISTGITAVSYTDVAAHIDPTTVHFKSITSPDRLDILEQNFEYDIVNALKIMQKYVDKAIRLVTEKGEIYEGKLLSASDDDIILTNEEGGIKVIRGKTVLYFDFPDLPEGLITRPTLIWMVNNTGPKKQETELSYLTTGINWHAEYVAVVGPKDTNINLGGWVSLDNRSGATFKDAKLKLVAGDIHLAEKKGLVMLDVGESARMTKAAAPQFEEKSFFEYHMYTLQRKTTLKNNQTKQISLFPPSDTKTEKVFIFDGARYRNNIRVNLEFINSKKDGLGIPLPEGKIRVYKEDTDHALEFIGEDWIDHTPSDEKVRIYLGNAFDLVGERIQKASRKISTRAREDSYEISLRNHKGEAAEIVVVEHLYGDWNITEKSHAFRKKDAYTAEFKVPVPAKGETTVTYTVVFQW